MSPLKGQIIDSPDFVGGAALPLPDSPEGRKQHTPVGLGGLAVSQQNLVFESRATEALFLDVEHYQNVTSGTSFAMQKVIC